MRQPGCYREHARELRRSLHTLSVALSFAVACGVTIPEARLRCKVSTDCPAGWSCHSDLRCHSQGELVPDAGMSSEGHVQLDASADAARDAGADAGRDAGAGLGSAGMSGAPAAGRGGSSVEDCFDGVDNDADQRTDCEDPYCDDGAACAAAPDGFELGVVVDKDGPCPPGSRETKLFRGLSGGSECTGCSCTPDPVRCEADVFVYPNMNECEADSSNSGGKLARRVSEPCVDMGMYEPIESGYGFRVGVVATVQTCQSAGAPSVAPAAWAKSQKFCAFAAVGGGCSTGQRCVPRQASPSCALRSGSALCDGYSVVEKDWYTGSQDTRSCDSCTCEAVGGACEYPRVEVGSDYACNAGSVGDIPSSSKKCTYSYSPPVGLRANKRDPTCNASSAVSGALTPTGQQTLCCTASAP